MEIDYCSECDCGQKRPIVNKTHVLCSIKNKLRIERVHGEKKVSKKTIRSKSKKKQIQDRDYAEVCKEIMELRGPSCEGCGAHQRLSFSHIIPRSKRPDLTAIALNIQIHCMSFGGHTGCHNKWEAKDWYGIVGLKQCLIYVHTVDEKYFWQIVNKYRDMYANNPPESTHYLVKITDEITLKVYKQRVRAA